MNQRRKRALWVVAAVGVVAILGFGLAQVRKSRAKEGARECQQALAKLQRAKELRAPIWKDEPGYVLDWNEIDPHHMDWPQPTFSEETGPFDRECRYSGADYILNPIGTAPVCPSGLPGHSLLEISGRDGGAER